MRPFGRCLKQTHAGYHTIVELGLLSRPNKWYQSHVMTVHNNLQWAPQWTLGGEDGPTQDRA